MKLSEAVLPITIEAQRPGKSASVNGLMALSLIVALAFSFICAAILWQERRGARDHAAETISNLIEAINSDIARNIEQYDLSLQGVDEGLKLPDLDKVTPQTRRFILFDHSSNYKYLGAIRVLDALGKTVLDSRGSAPGSEDFSTEDLFLVHINVSNAGLYVSRPFKARNGEPVIAFSRRLSSADGSFSGVVMGTLRLAYFHDLFKKVAPSPRSALTLFATDGTVLMRLPFRAADVGHPLPNAYVLKEFQKARSGHYENVALLDGVHRLYGFKQVGDLPLLMTMGLPIDEVYAGWKQDAIVVGVLIIALCAATIFSSVLLRRELRRRMAAEEKLAVLATTDSLTGLSNRRHFDEVIEREWQRAMREKTSVAFLMVDADYFKVYNDTHGHQAGDRFLADIGSCIAGTARRATDLGARYGGDEFAVLLPGTGGPGALEIAERLRMNIARRVAGPEGTVPSVSIGVAAIVPRPQSRYHQLINAADKALYDAKTKGRNRSEWAETNESSTEGPRLVA